MNKSVLKAAGSSHAASRGAVREEIQRQRDILQSAMIRAIAVCREHHAAKWARELQADLDAAHWEAFGHCVPVEAD